MNNIKEITKLLIALFMGITLSGCMASTYNEMITKPDIIKKAYIVEQNYQILYKNALDMSDKCYATGMLTAAIIADGQLFTESKSARISIYLMGGLGKQMHHGAEIKAINTNRSELTLYTEFNNLEILETMKKEFTGKCRECGCEDVK